MQTESKCVPVGTCHMFRFGNSPSYIKSYSCIPINLYTRNNTYTHSYKYRYVVYGICVSTSRYWYSDSR